MVASLALTGRTEAAGARAVLSRRAAWRRQSTTGCESSPGLCCLWKIATLGGGPDRASQHASWCGSCNDFGGASSDDQRVPYGTSRVGRTA